MRIAMSWVVLLAASGVVSCSARPQSGEPQNSEQQKPLPASSLQHHLQVDSTSLPTGVTARERQVPGTSQVQTWISNDTGIPFVIDTVDREGSVIRRQKIAGGRVYLQTPPAHRAADEPDTDEWQLLEGVSEVLITLNYTPKAIVAGRELQAGRIPAPEAFSIAATFGGKAAPIRGHIIYSATAQDTR